jgi:hypothetical protein
LLDHNEPFVRFDLVDRPFDWPLVPTMCDACTDSVIISLNLIDNAHTFFNQYFGLDMMDPCARIRWKSSMEKE